MEHKIFKMEFGKVYNMLVNKVERKGREEGQVIRAITWLLGYDEKSIYEASERGISMEEFFAKAPLLNPKREHIKGSICGVKIDEIEDPLMKLIRQLDKIVDQIAKGKDMGKILT